jgi:hypothetical protein
MQPRLFKQVHKLVVIVVSCVPTAVMQGHWRPSSRPVAQQKLKLKARKCTKLMVNKLKLLALFWACCSLQCSMH